MSLIDQPTATPVRKLQYGGAAGLLVWIATEFWGVDQVPPAVEGLIPVLAMAVTAYMTREKGAEPPDYRAMVTAAVREAMAGVTVSLQGRCAESARCKLHAGHEPPCDFRKDPTITAGNAPAQL